jgi:predicted transport protein
MYAVLSNRSKINKASVGSLEKNRTSILRRIKYTVQYRVISYEKRTNFADVTDQKENVLIIRLFITFGSFVQNFYTKKCSLKNGI